MVSKETLDGLRKLHEKSDKWWGTSEAYGAMTMISKNTLPGLVDVIDKLYAFVEACDGDAALRKTMTFDEEEAYLALVEALRGTGAQ